MATAYKFQAPPGLPFQTISIRETDGRDEQVALETAKAAKTTYADELTKLSIAKVDGKAVSQPFDEYDRWPTRARLYVDRAWAKINGLEAEKLEDFLESAAAEEVSAGGANIDDFLSERGSAPPSTSQSR